MVNMEIFRDLLNCAYDLDILYFQYPRPEMDVQGVAKQITHICYIMTNDGDIEIHLTEKVELIDGEIEATYLANFKSNLRSIEVEKVKDLIQSQLEVEAVLDKHNKAICNCMIMS